MKKLCAVVFIFVLALAAAGVWFSPLAALGETDVYCNNEKTGETVGAVYPQCGYYRIDIDCSSEKEMLRILGDIGAKEVKRAETGGVIIVYAYSERVCGKTAKTSDGKVYNVMCAYDGAKLCIGTPVLQGCF